VRRANRVSWVEGAIRIVILDSARARSLAVVAVSETSQYLTRRHCRRKVSILWRGRGTTGQRPKPPDKPVSGPNRPLQAVIHQSPHTTCVRPQHPVPARCQLGDRMPAGGRLPENAELGRFWLKHGSPRVEVEPLRATFECQTATFHSLSSKLSTSENRWRPSDGGASASAWQLRMFDGEARASESRWVACFWAAFGPLSPARRSLAAERRPHTAEIECLRSTHAPKTAALGNLRGIRAGHSAECVSPWSDHRIHWTDMRRACAVSGAFPAGEYGGASL